MICYNCVSMNMQNNPEKQLGYYSLTPDVRSIFFKTNIVPDRTHDHFRQSQAKQS